MCISTKGKSSSQVMSRIIGNSGANQPSIKEIFNTGLEFQSTFIYWIIVIAGILYMLGLVFLALLKIQMKKTTRSLNRQRITAGLLWTSTALIFAASLSLTQTTTTLRHWPSQAVTVEAGSAVQVLQWLATAFSLLFSAGVWYMLEGQSGTSSFNKGGFDSSGGYGSSGGFGSSGGAAGDW